MLSLVAACAIAAPACGDDEERRNGADRAPSSGPGQTRVKSQSKGIKHTRYLLQGNRICRNLVRDAQRIRGQDLFAADRPNLARGFRRLAAAVEEALARLRRLGSPRGNEEAVTRMHEQAQGGLTVLRRAARDRRLATRIAGGRLNPLAEAAKSARELGLSECLAL